MDVPKTYPGTRGIKGHITLREQRKQAVLEEADVIFLVNLPTRKKKKEERRRKKKKEEEERRRKKKKEEEERRRRKKKKKEEERRKKKRKEEEKYLQNIREDRNRTHSNSAE